MTQRTLSRQQLHRFAIRKKTKTLSTWRHSRYCIPPSSRTTGPAIRSWSTRAFAGRLPAVILTVSLTACAPAVVQGTRTDDVATDTTTPMVSGEALIVMNADSTLDDDDGFASCVRTSIANAETGLHIMAEKEFRNSLFPWFEQMINEPAIAALISKPLVRNRIAELRVRYIIAVAGSTKSEWGKGWGSGGAYIGESGVMSAAQVRAAPAASV